MLQAQATPLRLRRQALHTNFRLDASDSLLRTVHHGPLRTCTRIGRGGEPEWISRPDTVHVDPGR